MPPSLTAQKILDLRAVGVAGEVIDWSISLDKSVTVLAAMETPEYRRRDEDGGSAYHGYSRRVNKYTIYQIEHSLVTAVALPPTIENFGDVRRLGNDRFLLVRGRRRRGEPPNGVIVDADGAELKRINLGDLVQHIFVTPDDALWLGYGDEVFGDPLPAGGGVTHLDRRGKVLFAYNKSSAGEAGACLDAYAMSIDADGTVWAYVYPGFPLVKIDGAHKVATYEASAVRGARAVAVRGERALFFGDYDNPSEISRLDLRTNRRRRMRVATPRGRLLEPTHAMGIDGVLYLRERHTIYAASVEA
jgi:hypothetical protein